MARDEIGMWKTLDQSRRQFLTYVPMIIVFFSSSLRQVNAIRVKRQEDKSEKKTEETFEQELCKNKDAGEWFRLVANEGDSCRDVIQCTTSVRSL